MNCMGPGRKSAFAAVSSENDCGLSSVSIRRMRAHVAGDALQAPGHVDQALHVVGASVGADLGAALVRLSELGHLLQGVVERLRPALVDGNQLGEPVAFLERYLEDAPDVADG